MTTTGTASERPVRGLQDPLITVKTHRPTRRAGAASQPGRRAGRSNRSCCVNRGQLLGTADERGAGPVIGVRRMHPGRRGPRAEGSRTSIA
jgi:hypothetical protein